MTILYHISIHLYFLLLLAASLFNRKARSWVAGRWGWRSKLLQWRNPSQRVVWIHAASLGEFEQGRPLIEDIRRRYPDYKILLTFYSPSGFEVRKNYPGADYIMYLPLDTRYNARRFVKVVNPAIVIFVKYEYWRFYLQQLHASGHPVFLISAIFRPGQIFFRWYGAWFRKNLSFIDFFYVQDERSASLLRKLGILNCDVSGDTRFDRVAAVASAAKEVNIARIFSEKHFCMVAGSTWPEDEELITRFLNETGDIRIIIAPHEITPPHLEQLKNRISGNCILFSGSSPETIENYQALIIDNMGMLSSLYRYARIAYIGGGFGKGIHNILEAAAFGIPVIFGPNYCKFREACELIRLGGAFPVQNVEELTEVVQQLSADPGKYERVCLIAGNYVRDNTGATEIIMASLSRNLVESPSGL